MCQTRRLIRGNFRFVAIFAALLTVLGAIVAAEDSKEDVIRKERKRFEGTWRVVTLEVDGNKSANEDARRLKVINGSDGTWSLFDEEKQIVKGTSTIDPSKKPKTIDFSVTEGDGKGNQHLGIYELTENTRRLCFAGVGKDRPTDFSATSGSDRILVTFERIKEK